MTPTLVASATRGAHQAVRRALVTHPGQDQRRHRAAQLAAGYAVRRAQQTRVAAARAARDATRHS